MVAVMITMHRVGHLNVMQQKRICLTAPVALKMSKRASLFTASPSAKTPPAPPFSLGLGML